MNPSFQRMMAETTRLTRRGDLQRATAAIRAALGHGAVTPAQGEDTGVIDVDAREVDPRSVPTPRPAPHAGEFIVGSHTCAAGTREYKLYVPPGYRGQALPLIVMLHGCTQNPDDFAAGTGMNDAALERDFLVLYPAQMQRDNHSRCWNWFKHNHQRRGHGEPELLAGMTRDVMRRYQTDAQRVYVAGLSAGGAMAAILGDAYPDLFAAVGVHSGLPTGSASDVKSAFTAMKVGSSAASTGHTPPTIVFHGDQDTTVHPINGERVVAASAGDAIPERVHAPSANGRAVTRCNYRDSSGRVVAEHWLVHGAGHAWSGGSARGSYTDAKGPDATEEMLRFFFANAMHVER
jgi:poly(hydroxyalkanoate) depolymerase family esterase